MHPQILLHGFPERTPEPVELRTGSLTLQYDRGFLRYIKAGETEVLRMINYLIRDRDWVTIPMNILSESIEESPSGFRISYQAECILGSISYRWSCVITGEEDTITLEVDGESTSSFLRNRLGITVLHPIGPCAGKHCTITHSDRRQEILKFPELISPHQPFLDITEMRWNPTDSIDALLQFEGDIFETEDQRNWSDNSYKTYCTPLSRPFPVAVKPGDRIRQSVRLSVENGKRPVTDRKHPLTFTLQRQGSTHFPHVGVAWSNLEHDAKTIERIRGLNVDFIRVNVDLKDPHLLKSLQPALKAARYLGLVIVAGEKPDVSFVEKILPVTDRIREVTLLPAEGNSTQSQLIDAWVGLLRKSFPKAKTGGGTDAFFTELNRERTPPEHLDFLSFSINPQTHASDHYTMVENLEAQRDIVHSARALAAGKEIHVGPVTLKIRPNPSAATGGDPGAGVLPPYADPRQLSMFGACWMLGSFKYLAENSVSAITFFETCGWNGLLPHQDQPWPETFIDNEDAVYPMYVVLKELMTHKQKRVIKLESSSPLVFDGIALTEPDGHLLIFLVNFTGKDQLLTLPVEAGLRRAAIIDDFIMNKWIKDPEGQFLIFKEISTTIALPPYSIGLFKQ